MPETSDLHGVLAGVHDDLTLAERARDAVLAHGAHGDCAALGPDAAAVDLRAVPCEDDRGAAVRARGLRGALCRSSRLTAGGQQQDAQAQKQRKRLFHHISSLSSSRKIGSDTITKTGVKL